MGIARFSHDSSAGSPRGSVLRRPVVIVFTSGSEETGGNKSKTAKLATFARNTPTKTRVSRRAIERDATRAKRLVVFGEIVETPLDKGAEINALAKLPSCPTIQDERAR
jgi:hypothetical protein